MTSSTEWDLESLASSTSSSTSSFDEDEVNARVSPDWAKYNCLIRCRGFRLDTVRDVKEYYQRHCSNVDGRELHAYYLSGYRRILARSDEDALCKDAGLRDSLFRATRSQDGLKVMIKAVHRDSRELDIVRYLSAPAQRRDPMNHCIPILDLIDTQDDICFIVMEEWSRNMFPETPVTLGYLLVALLHCIEHIVFMHRHHITHLDISLHNFLTDYKGRYACIDYELSRRIEKASTPRIVCFRGTEMPPEVERGRPSNPFMVDVWALGILILRACKLAGIHVPELMHLAKSMLNENPDKRPPAATVLKELRRIATTAEKNTSHLPLAYSLDMHSELPKVIHQTLE